MTYLVVMRDALIGGAKQAYGETIAQVYPT